jgi:hypothetical protein
MPASGRFLPDRSKNNPPMRREDELIWLFSLAAGDQTGLDKLTSLVQEKLDWEYVINAASQEGVASLVYDRIKKNQLELFIPQTILSSFESIYYTYSAANTLLYAELKNIFSALEEGGIPVILLKGGFLAANIYENIALRPMRDLDLLVKKKDILSSAGILERSGYLPIVKVKEQLEDCCAYSITLAKENAGIYNSVSLDLHWHILNTSWLMALSSKKCDIEQIWARAEQALVLDIPVRVLAPAHLFICLAVNAFTHCYQRIILLADLSHFLKRYKKIIDWDSLRQEARRCGLENILDHTLKFISGMPLLRKPQGILGSYAFRRVYQPWRPCLMFVLLQRGIIAKCKAVFGLILAITCLLFKRLEHKKT